MTRYCTIQCVPIYTEPYKQMVKITNPQQIMMIKTENNSFIEKKKERSQKNTSLETS